MVLFRGFLLVVGFFLAHAANAQIINVEGKRDQNRNEGLHGNIDLSFTYVRNTKDIFTYGFKSHLQYLKDRHRVLLLSDLKYVEAGGDQFINQSYIHTRYNYDFGENRSFSAEAFQQGLTNGVQDIRVRYLAGAGLRWNAVDDENLKFWLGSLPMYEFEESTTGYIERNWRQSSYFLFFFTFKQVEFQTINYYQPRLDLFEDYRISSNNSLEFGVFKWLRFTSGFEILYDTRVPAGIPNVVFTFENGLRIEF